MRKKTKRTPPACTPRSWEDADNLMAEFGELSSQSVRIQAGCDDAVAKVMATFQAQLAPKQERMAVIVEALQCYATANRKALTDDGKTKTVTMTAGSFGWRCCPPSVVFRKGLKAEDVIANIRALAKEYAANGTAGKTFAAVILSFIRLKEEPNKNAMLENSELAEEVDGVKIITDKEEFFVDPTVAELPEPK